MDAEVIRWEGEAPEDSDLERLFEKRKLSHYSFSNSQGDNYPVHEHTYNKFLVMVRGTMRFRIEENTFDLNRGDHFILPAHTKHSAMALTDTICMEAQF